MSIRQYWFVLWELTKRELKRKYARSFLGILWSCVYPLMRMALVVLLFSTIFNKVFDVRVFRDGDTDIADNT